MQLTSLKLKKPEQTDPVDIQDLNDNAELIDAELKKRPEKTGSASDMTVAFTEPQTLGELSSGDTLKGLFGKLKLAVKNVISIARLLGTTDISAIGGGTVTGAISTLNSNLAAAYINQDLRMRIAHYVWSGELIAKQTTKFGSFDYAIPSDKTFMGMLLTPRANVPVTLMYIPFEVYGYSPTYTGPVLYDAYIFYV